MANYWKRKLSGVCVRCGQEPAERDRVLGKKCIATATRLPAPPMPLEAPRPPRYRAVPRFVEIREPGYRPQVFEIVWPRTYVLEQADEVRA